MYYETKIINGVLCERFSSKVAFRECSREAITKVLIETENTLREAYAKSAELENKIKKLEEENHYLKTV